MDLSRDQLLACATPRDLFADAMGDRRALKKAYARLARRFRPEDDPEAFQHLRRLYEDAQRVDQEEAAPEAVPDGAAPSAECSIFEATRDDMARPDFLRRVSATVQQPPWAADEATLQRTLELLDAVPPDIPLDLDHLARLEDRLLDGLAGHGALADPEVPDALVELAGRSGDRLTLARAFMALAEAVPYDELVAGLRRAELRHPAVWSLFALAHGKVVADAAARRGWMDGEAIEGNDAPVFEGDVPMARLGRFASGGVGVAAASVVRLSGFELGTAVTAYFLTQIVWHGIVAVHRSYRGVFGLWTDASRQYARGLMAAGHWPHEVLDRSLPTVGIAPDERGYQPDMSFLNLDRDLAFLPYVLTPAHLARLERECSP